MPQSITTRIFPHFYRFFAVLTLKDFYNILIILIMSKMAEMHAWTQRMGVFIFTYYGCLVITGSEYQM
jgi:hypothetical protein